MPLHTNCKMIDGIQLDSLYDFILRANGGDAEIVADAADRLVMTGIAFRFKNSVGC